LDPEKSEKDCIFCKIVSGEIPTAILYQDEDVVVFPDVKPVTPVHLLIVTRKHIPSLADMTDDDTPLVGKMVKVANELAREQGISEKGYRITINSGKESGQLVPHLHMHLMGGRTLRWSH
jgi:histidine triad (HIT) family protein